MRWLFGLLLLANVGLLMWGAWYRPPLASTMLMQLAPDVAPQKLKLLSEPGVRLLLRPKTPANASADAASQQCYRLGPFRNPERLRVATERLESWDLSYERQSEMETLGLAYRVYLRPLPTREEADARRRELTRLGFTDHAVIVDEDGRGYTVSLGIFGVEQNAQVRLKQLAAKKISASIQVVPKVRAMTWLVLAGLPGSGQIGDVPLSRFTDEDWGSPDIALSPGACQPDPGDIGPPR
jgi:hypothetical protein